ncbi:MAG TPA: radical SAM protein [Thermoanaerobaculia bacterium]|nr:radical SAM protein [Thermoanaerobaculia bacterium]
MKVALVFPPLADATQPYSSLAALAGFLRSRGNHEVVLHDANVECVRRLLTRDRVGAAVAPDDDPLSALKMSIVRDGIDDAVADLQSPDTFGDLHRLNHAQRIVRDAWAILNLSPSIESYSAAELDRAARDRHAPLPALLEEVLRPALQSAAPDAVGISITYRSQIVPAIASALLVKRLLPGVPVIFGGQIATLWQAVVADAPQLFDWCDFLIAFEGETALEALLTALAHRRSLDDVPNLAYRRDGRVRVNRVHVEAIDALPTPDYCGLPLQRYLAPQPVFLLNASRGCYWSKCEFCSVSPSMRRRFRMRRPDLVLDDVATLQARHGARCISFADDCVPPRMLRALAGGLRERELALSWQCEVRFEPQLDRGLLGELSAAGCRNLIFGLESYAPRVLEAMNKGVRHSEIRRILDDCRRYDIAVNLQLFFGFPGETADDARRTMEFVAGEMHGALTASFGTFRLQRGSGVALRPDAFGIRMAGHSPPLAVELAYEPKPEHAENFRRELHEEMLRRTSFQSLPLSLDAHTLLYLHASGVAAMAKEYYVRTVSVSPDDKLVRGIHQTITEGVLYDYDRDRAAELSPLALWLIEQLDEPRSTRRLAQTLARATGERAAELLPTLNAVATALLERGMVSVVRRTKKAQMTRGCEPSC